MFKILLEVLWFASALYNLYVGHDSMAIFCALMLIWTEIALGEGKQ